MTYPQALNLAWRGKVIKYLEKNNFKRDTVFEDEPTAKEVIYSLKSPLFTALK